MGRDPAIVIGAGIGGLAAAIDLAAAGIEVVVLEAARQPGGKMARVDVGGAGFDAGPTVLTLREVFDQLLDDAGSSLRDHVKLQPLALLARHHWRAGETLDLHADAKQSADAIGDFAGAREAQGFLRFSQRAREIFETLDASFMTAQRPSPAGLVASAGVSGLARLARISPFISMWSELGRYFRDARLRQLFARYATYCGSSPFQAPATLMLVAHAEQKGVWIVEGGMHRLAQALASLAIKLGATIRYGVPAAEIVVRHGRVTGVRTEAGEMLPARIVVNNSDVSALAEGALGRSVTGATAGTPAASRSLSAVTWLIDAPATGFPLHRHNVFFSQDYAAEFADIFERGSCPRDPTVYVCAQDRDDAARASGDRDRLLILVNAPPIGDRHPFSPMEIESCRDRMFRRLDNCGLRIVPENACTTTPSDFHQRFPGTGGALYGRASHGWTASFQRPGARTRIPGLYLAGGSVHPGPGVPMAAISGRLAAQAILTDLASTSRSRPTAMRGGTSTRSAMTVNKG
jgi:1-hydroxycarotenoid 3,4-desaturase